MVNEILKNCLLNLKIVYVEDDSAIRDNLCEFFKRINVPIYSTSNAEEGLELYEKHKPDIMIVDINLPGMNGIELVSIIRKKDKYTRLIITTAYTNPEFTIEAIELNITRYLVKPITSKNLFPALEKSLEELGDISNKYLNVSLGEDFFFNMKSEKLFKGKDNIELRKKEVELLKFFITNENETITYEMLENTIWGNKIMTNDALRGQIRNLRKKTYPDIVKNVSGIGYKLSKAS